MRNRVTLLGPVLWILSIQYFIIQIIVADAWHSPGYSWLHNYISDLGNTVCGYYGARYVCSPLHPLMNASFIALGTLMIAGSLLTYRKYKENLDCLFGFGFMAIAGIGTILVGTFPENTIRHLHTFGADLAFIFGNLSMVVLGLSLYKVKYAMRVYSLLSGVIALIALAFSAGHDYFGVGVGGMERIQAYPQAVWLIVFGVYALYTQLKGTGDHKVQTSAEFRVPIIKAMSQRLHVIYIPGLGDEQEPKGQIWAVRRWHRYGINSELFRMRWGDGKPWQPKFERLLARIDQLASENKDVGLVAASAGASVAVNAFAERPGKVVGIVLIAGKVNRVEAIHPLHYTKNPAMPASVKQAAGSLAVLDSTRRRRILSRYGLIDGYVKRADSYIPGACNRPVLTFGHFFNIAFQLTFGAPSFIRFLKKQALATDR